MLPNPFQKQLPEFKDTDPLKNREIVRELLGPEGVHKYRKILGDNSDSNLKRQKEVSKEDLLAMAAEAHSKIDTLSRDSVKPILERLIERQYTSQIQSLQEIGFLEPLVPQKKKGFTIFKSKEPEETTPEKLGATDILGTFREVPTEEAIKNHFLSIPNIKQKIDQGFTRLLIVPFGSSLDTLRSKTGELIKKHKKENKLLAGDGSSLELDTTTPLWAWDEYNNADKSGKLVYYPEHFDAEHHNGKTKTELLSSVPPNQSNSSVQNTNPFPGYHILLIQEDPIIPREGKGSSQAGRDQIEAGKSPNNYLELLTTDKNYSKELGLTPEDWLTLFATNLTEKNKVINDYASQKDSINYLIGSYFPGSDRVPDVDWDRGDKRAGLSRNDPAFVGEYVGVSGAVG